MKEYSSLNVTLFHWYCVSIEWLKAHPLRVRIFLVNRNGFEAAIQPCIPCFCKYLWTILLLTDTCENLLYSTATTCIDVDLVLLAYDRSLEIDLELNFGFLLVFRCFMHQLLFAPLYDGAYCWFWHTTVTHNVHLLYNNSMHFNNCISSLFRNLLSSKLLSDCTLCY